MIVRFACLACIFTLLSQPSFATTDDDIRQKLQEHLQKEQDVVQKLHIADQGDAAACQQFDGSTETKSFTSRQGEDYHVTVVGRATTKEGTDPVYAKLNSEANRFAEETCRMTGYSGTQAQYYSNGVCANSDPKTKFPYRLVTGGFNCHLCDEKCQADLQASRQKISEDHKNDVHITRYIVHQGDRLTGPVIAIHQFESSLAHPESVLKQVDVPPDLSTLPHADAGTIDVDEAGWSRTLAQAQQRELDDNVMKRLVPDSILITYVVKRGDTVVGTHKVGEMVDGTREILPSELSSNLHNVMMQTIETTESGWNNVQTDIARQAARSQKK